MNTNVAITLLKNLLNRIEADANHGNAKFAGLVSEDERDALALLLREASVVSATPAPEMESCITPTLKASEDVASAPSPELGEEPTSAASSSEVISDATAQQTVPEANKFASLQKDVGLCKDAFRLTAPENPEVLLCLDFGTAKSKAFACSHDGDEDVRQLELGIGYGPPNADRDNDVDGKIYCVTSSVWIDNDGLVFVGSEAFRRGQSAEWGKNRSRLDSLKQELILALPSEKLGSNLLPKSVNPTDEPLTYGDAITYYLAYLTDLAVSELEDRHHISRYVRRRFTLPCWDQPRRTPALRFMSERVACAQALADTFHGSWREGVHAKDIRKVIQEVLSRSGSLKYLLDTREQMSAEFSPRWGGVLEPLASGSARVWNDIAQRELVVVLDVGAGTCDFSIFWVDLNFTGRGHRAFPVVPGWRALRKAGDTLDSLLVKELLDRAHLGGNEAYRLQVGQRIQNSGIRLLKERLFNSGELRYEVVDSEVVISLEEFLASDGVSRFTQDLENTLQDFLSSVDPSWRRPMEGAKLVLTGGGCSLPMVENLKRKAWDFGGQTIHFRPVDPVPNSIAATQSEEFIREYPQLSVALGGALPTILDEAGSVKQWSGGTPPPGPLTRFAITGS